MVVNMDEVMMKILQSSVVTQTMFYRRACYISVANLLRYICTKNYESWLAVDKVIATIIKDIATIIRLNFSPCIAATKQ